MLAPNRRPATPAHPAQPRSKPVAPSQRPPLARGVRSQRLHALFSEYRGDLVGLGLVLAGILIACGVYGNFGGSLGSWVRTGLGASIGLLSYFVPPALAALGVFVIGLPRYGDTGEESFNGFKVATGALVAVVGLAGLAHLLGGQPDWGDTYDAFATAGGLLGAAVLVPLKALMGSFAAGCVLVAMALFGVIVACRSNLRSFGRGVVWALVMLGKGCRLVWRGFDRLLSDDEPYQYMGEHAGADPAAPAAAATGAAGNLPLLSTYAMGSAQPGEIYDYNQDEGVALRDGTSAPPADLATEASDVDLLADLAGDPPTKAASAAKRAAKAKLSAAEAATDSATAEASPEELKDMDDSELADLTALGEDTPVRPSTTWTLPPADLLMLSDAVDLDEARAQERGKLLEESLEAHGVSTRLVGMVIGPTVTRYELELGQGVKVARVTSLHKDIAYAMASPDVRIMAPIPGRRAIGVEVPNINRQTVLVGDILNSTEAGNASHPLDVAVGRDITGRSIMLNLARMPHLLIAGSTGSGKSSCVNAMLTSILMRSTPEDLRLILIDPKMVEMRQFEKVPHLLTDPVVDPKKAANALNWAVKEMDRRYQLLSTAGFRDIAGYNEAYAAGDLEGAEEFPHLPLILVVVDELADLMMVAARDVEDAICRIAQKARAVGIHLIIATQRPSTDVLTGVIKANVPARLAFSVSSLIDSRVILDQPGAERLVGQGDMLLLGPSSSAPRRIQGAWVSEAEVQKVVGFWRRQVADKGDAYEAALGGSQEIVAQSTSRSAADGDEDDELLLEAMEIVVSAGTGSTSMLQRKLRVGFARAGRLMDLLEAKGVVGPSEGSKSREVYLTGPELAQMKAEQAA